MILAQMKTLTYSTFSSYSLSIMPLFLLMGQFATLGGMSPSLFQAAETWLGHRKRRRGDGGDRRLRRLRRDLRLVAGDGRDDGAGGAAGTAPLRLFRRAGDRRRWRPAARSAS